MNNAVSPEAYQVDVPDRVGPPGPIVPCLDEGPDECRRCDDQCGSASEYDYTIWDMICGLDHRRIRETALLVVTLPNSLNLLRPVGTAAEETNI